MKKTLLCAVFLPLVLNAQDYSGRVGINTDKPKATLEISKVAVGPTMPATKAQGVLFPKFTSEERTKFSGTAEEGTIIYNIEKRCLEMYLGLVSGVPHWACLPDVASAKSQSVAVTAAGFEGSYVGGVPFTGANKAKFKLENNSFSTVSSSFADAVTVQNGMATISAGNCQWQKLNGSTLIGSAASCAPPNLITLNSGESALLTYTMSGTPATGTLTANFSKLGAQADQSTAVGLGTASITSPKTEYVVSLVYDGTTPKTEVQGKINNTSNKLIVKIPYENGSGSYNEVTSQPIATTAGQDNDSNTLTLNIPAGNFGVNGYLEATISVDGDGEYLVKMLAPGEEYTIATIPYTLNGNNYEVVLKGIGGIPDRCFGKTTFDCVGYGAKELEHQFIYIPIQGPDGKTWLNNDLGAEYARVGSQWFNPAYQAGALDPANTTTAVPLSNPTADQIKKDWRAYGSLFQWQRNPDGHELMKWTSSTRGVPKYTSISTLSSSWTNPGHNNFIVKDISYITWVIASLHNASTQKDLWQSSGTGKTNPCPSGYHVPTYDEQVALHNAILGYNAGNNQANSAAMWNERVLRLSASGSRTGYEGGFDGLSTNNRLWSSTQDNSGYTEWFLLFASSYSYMSSSYPRGAGVSVRCIKD
ncbi:FISUMP domain-containing protein [Riemerella anatipestifer]|nr:FISUMP domain-containing protein [Riemerella anatipestifer]